MPTSRMIRVGTLVAASLLAGSGHMRAQGTEWGPQLPDTDPLELTEPLDVVMVRGMSQHAERALQDAGQRRSADWLTRPSNTDSGRDDRAAARAELRECLGMRDAIIAQPLLWRGVSPGIPRARHPKFEVQTVHWQVFEDVTGTGLLATPVHSDDVPPLVLVAPDADQSPEMLFGLAPGLPPESQIARRLAENGCAVICISLIDRDCTWSGHDNVRWTNLPHREYLYRLAFELGRHPVGYEVAKLQAALTASQQAFGFETTGVIGVGEGGLLALCLGAVNPDPLAVVAVCGYFQARENVWQEPIYRNLFGQLTRFGDAELATLIAPRPFIVEGGPAPEIDGPPDMQGRSQIAAPGRIRNPPVDSVRREFDRLAGYLNHDQASPAVSLIINHGPHAGHPDTLERLLSALRSAPAEPSASLVRPEEYESQAPIDQEFAARRSKSQVREIVQHTQRLLAASDKDRQQLWGATPKDLADWESRAAGFRARVHKTFIGRLPVFSVPLHPRSRKVIDEPTHVGYEVVLDVVPAPAVTGTQASRSSVESADWGVVAGGILLLPKDLRPDERRPVVVCQHGLEGTPQDTITVDNSTRSWRAYKGFSTQLVQRGFIVYAPQNPYRGQDAFRVIQRKSNPLGRSLFSYIIEQHRRTLEWLAGLPWVDRDRIAFYGLSYGGKTAVRVPPLLVPDASHPGYCLSICSADFNEWIRKNVSAEDRYSYVYTPEYEIFEWNMGHEANYAELASLMAPRPFMVERGHDDGVAPDEWVAWEYAKVRRLYTKLGIPNRTEIEFFDGPHTINGQGTFEFLHRHLDWPEPGASR